MFLYIEFAELFDPFLHRLRKIIHRGSSRSGFDSGFRSGFGRGFGRGFGSGFGRRLPGAGRAAIWLERLARRRLGRFGGGVLRKLTRPHEARHACTHDDKQGELAYESERGWQTRGSTCQARQVTLALILIP
jgi:hypothetical protein